MKRIPLTWDPVEGAKAYRLMLYDRTIAETIFDETVPANQHPISLSQEQCAHDVAMRVRVLFEDSSWGEWGEYRPLPLEVVLGKRRSRQRPLSLADDVGLLLVFTIDTECSVLRQPSPNPDRVVDELIFGDFGRGGRRAGIGLYMDLLEHFGFRGCFFVDILMEFEHGQAAHERVIEAILSRGHEVELHVHPEHLQKPRDSHARQAQQRLSGGRVWQDQDLFRQLMEVSVELFERRVGRAPVAYRAGGYRSYDIQFPVLEEFGIQVDSSVQPYFNSQVSDWMRTRTQPFRVGSVLEIPPTYFVVNENQDRWETRSFTPYTCVGDPVSRLPEEVCVPPRVATFVAHSFDLLSRYESDDQDEVETHMQLLRSSLPADLASRYFSTPPESIRTFGAEVDERLVAAVAGTLRRIADRPDARCATYGELTGLTDQLWPAGQYSPVDVVPLLDRHRGVAGVSGTRVLSGAFLAHLATAEEESMSPGELASESLSHESTDARLPREDLNQFRSHLCTLARQADPGIPIQMRFRTLGVVSPAQRGTLPPLAELLFPPALLAAAASRAGAELTTPVEPAWDGRTFRTWLQSIGFEVLSERRVNRDPRDLAAIEAFKKKLQWLDPVELRTDEIYFEVVRSENPPSRPHFADANLLLPQAAADALFDSVQVGCEISFSIEDADALASTTTRLLALMRAGFEILERVGSTYRLLRPIELSDIRRFAGVHT